MRKLLHVLVILSVIVPIGYLHAGSSEIGERDAFWAKWDGIDPEVYMMMKDMDSLMTDMIQKASIAKEAKKESEFEKWAGEKLSDKILGAAGDYNPAVSPIKKMHDYAMKGTKSWLDWGMRKNVDLVYRKYIDELKQSGDPKRAQQEVSLWIKDQQEVVMNNKEARELEVLAQDKDLLLAAIVKTHRKHHPEQYKPDKPIRAIFGVKPEPEKGAFSP